LPLPPVKRYSVTIRGIVQGVGFRPFVYRLASEAGLSGWVRNGSDGVTIEIQGVEKKLDKFLFSLQHDAPPLALINSLQSIEITPAADSGFRIIASSNETGSAPVPPDCDVCPDCLRELFDPEDRRYRYPFINCTNCGPRYSIITATPYDRPNTTMAMFPLCPDCEREYNDPLNRRFHAQPVACPECGPSLEIYDATGNWLAGDPLSLAVAGLKSGRIVAVKGVGGYHLAVDPGNSAAVMELRRRKRRDEKPFALLAASLEAAALLAEITPLEARFLTSVERPILLLPKRDGQNVAPEVAPANGYFGIMLPSNPLQHLLMQGNFAALVMTSANVSEEPVIYRDDEALRQLSGIADLFLSHNRPIHEPSDDSVIRVFRTNTLLMRRSRGYVPRAIRIPEIDRPVFAAGGELKAAICLASGDQACPGRHIGDLKSAATLAEYGLSFETMKRIAGIEPEIAAFDLHPDYHSTRFAGDLSLPMIAVQHHHAHLAACMAENLLEGEVIGIIFDGTGLGDDGTIWGGEFLLGGYRECRRTGHLRQMLLPGGDAAATEPWRMAAATLYQLHGPGVFDLPLACFSGLTGQERQLMVQMLAKGINSPLSSSCGRLFDAVAAIIGLRSRMSYEGQAAIELEGLAERGCNAKLYPFALTEIDGALQLDWLPLLAALTEDVLAGEKKDDIAASFHRSLAGAAASVCREIRQRSGLDRIVLSGGVFQNRLLCEELVTLLETDGFKVFTHRLVPPNDGGLALGQAMIAGRSGLCV